MEAMGMQTLARVLSRTPVILASLAGLAAFLYPFIVQRGDTPTDVLAHAQDAPWLFFLLVALALLAVLADLETQRMDAKTVAVLGTLAAVNGALRLVPGPAGFSAVFFLLILCGYAYGPNFGFLLGALGLFVSALVTGGVGPWLPYQMFAAGWVGLTAGWLPDLRRWPRGELAVLAAFGLVWGFLFGALMNLWFWPYLAVEGAASWQPGLSAGEGLQRYAIFYLTTSLWWDLGRAAGNVLLILLFGRPILRLLRRFQKRFHFKACA